jgi:ketosteroid isomerase-like protein
MGWVMSRRFVLLLVGVLAVTSGCQRSHSITQTAAIPIDLKETIDTFTHAIEAFDLSTVLRAYAEDFMSGTGRSKDEVRHILTQLQENRVILKVEHAEVKMAGSSEATLETRLRLRYNDYFRDLGEGQVVVTDVLVHKLHKHADRWQIYTDERLATYREGRYGNQPPSIELEVPEKLPPNLNYPVKVVVRRETDSDYQVMIGNYAEDPAILPPPDIVTRLPEDGVLQANLLPNPQGLSEMVRITVIAEDSAGKWLGATTVSKLVPAPHYSQREASPEAI